MSGETLEPTHRAIALLLRAAESALAPERLAGEPGLRAVCRALLRWVVHALAEARGLRAPLRSIAAPEREAWSPALRECVDALDDFAWLDAAIERELAELLADELARIDRSLDRLGLLHEQLLDVRASRSSSATGEGEGEGEWTLTTSARGRKRSGTFYTPPELARATLDKALAPALAEQAALDLRVCDPAMGGAVFLLAALERLTLESGASRREVVERCLFGVDLDAHAVELARLALWLAVGEPGLACAFAAANLRHGDALVGWVGPCEDQARADLACARVLEPDRPPAEVVERWSPLHWSLAFPHVFEGPTPGFDLVIGNPPWAIRKPSSRAFFGERDPEFRDHDKQAALARAQELFDAEPGLRDAWQAERDRHRALTRWMAHAYTHQGGADPNSYKLFVERAHALLREGGRLALIVPAGIYADKGAAELRALLLDRCAWAWLYGFENAAGIFAIHRAFKFAVIVARKGGSTSSIRVAFMCRELARWQASEPVHVEVPRERITRLSPRAHAFVELDDARDLALLERLHDHADVVRLGDASERGWGVRYRREFDMTLDSHRFAPRPAWEARGLRPDEYDHWLAGDWRPIVAFGFDASRHALDPSGRWSILDRPPGLIVSREGSHAIELATITERARPVYEGRMIDLYDFGAKGWVAGRGRAATWWTIGFEAKRIDPQFLMASGEAAARREGSRLALGVMDVSAATNARTLIAALTLDCPHGNKVPILATTRERDAIELLASLGSLAVDFAARARLIGQTLNAFILTELPVLARGCLPARAVDLVLGLALPHVAFAGVWAREGRRELAWRRQWALDGAERTRRRVLLDAIVAAQLGLAPDDLAWLLRGCEATPYAKERHAKGFWRVDKTLPADQRLPARVLALHRELCERGLDELLAREAELASREVPVPRGDEAEASWRECERHAALLDALRSST